MHLCPICKVSQMLTGWCQLNSHVTVRLLRTVWPGSAHPNPRFGCALSYMILSLGKNKTHPLPHAFFSSRKQAKYFLSKYFTIYLMLNISEVIVFWRDKKYKFFARLERLQDRIRRDLPDTKRIPCLSAIFAKCSTLISNSLQHYKYKNYPSLTAFTKFKPS